MRYGVIFLFIFIIAANAYSTTDFMAGIGYDIVPEKSFDIFSNDDWLFGPSLRLEQNLIYDKEIYLNLLFSSNSASNKIFDNIKTEYSIFYISSGVSYRYKTIKDILSLYGGLNFVYGISDIKFVESIISYSDSAHTYGIALYSGFRINLPTTLFRSEGWTKQHWHELVTIGLDTQLGYRFLNSLSYEELKNSDYKVEVSKQFDTKIGEINISGPYIISSIVFVF
ncbi:MAG: hypothetical protein N2746_02850 [Deltaproteobacteria bacterium]|nr:hypothetical protein [Deltaproteobacteria bacterium]